MDKHKLSLQDLIKRRQARGFVGRRKEIDAFGYNLLLPVDDIRRRFIFNVYGDAGVGKTFLVHQLLKLAQERGCVTAYADESVYDVPALMDMIVAELGKQGKVFKNFSKKSGNYRNNLRMLDADPDVPAGLSMMLTRTAVRVGLRAAESIPVFGPFAKDVDGEAVVHQVEQVRDYLKSKFRNHEDIRLLTQPVKELTPVFLEELSAIGSEAPIALFFDTYERTGVYLETWLLDLLAGAYGDLPANTVLTVSGQHPLDANSWGSYVSVRSNYELRVFTEIESQELLATYGVTNSRVVELIGELTGHLPVLVAMLAGARPQQVEEVSDPSNDAVERFLKWEKDPIRRRVALLGALPRRLDVETLQAVAGDSLAAEQFSWICQLPFVNERADGYRYHDVVRATMLRAQRRRSPAEWKNKHDCLAAHYRALLDEPGVGKRSKRANERWQAVLVEEHYHKLCANVLNSLPEAYAAVVDSLSHAEGSTARLAETIRQAGVDSGDPSLAKRGNELLDCTSDPDNGRRRLLALLIVEPSLDPRRRAIVYEEQSELNIDSGNLSEAVDDINRAIELSPDDPRLIASRGRIYRLQRLYDDALTDLNRALSLDDNYHWAFEQRGNIYHDLKQYEAAIADYTRAVGIRDRCHAAFEWRGDSYWAIGDFEESTRDLTRAIELDPGCATSRFYRARSLRDMGRIIDSLSDVDAAIEIDPRFHNALEMRGQLHSFRGRFGQAISDLDRAIEESPSCHKALELRGRAYFLLGQYEDAVSDLNRAIERSPNCPLALSFRGSAYRMLDQFEAAIVDLEKARSLYGESASWCLYQIGLVEYKRGDAEVFRRYINEAIAHARGENLTLPANTGKALNISFYLAALNDRSAAIDNIRDVLACEVNASEVYGVMNDFKDVQRVFGVDFSAEIDLLRDAVGLPS